YSGDNNNLPFQNLAGLAISLPPITPRIYDEHGELNWENGTWSNPFAMVDYAEYAGKNENLSANASINYQLPLELQLAVNMGYNSLSTNEVSLIPLAAQDPAYAIEGYHQRSNQQSRSWIIEPKLSYGITLGN